MMRTDFPIDVVKADLRAVIEALNRGETTSVGLVKEYLRERLPVIIFPKAVLNLFLGRIEADDCAGRGLRAILQLAPENDRMYLPSS